MHSSLNVNLFATVIFVNVAKKQFSTVCYYRYYGYYIIKHSMRNFGELLLPCSLASGSALCAAVSGILTCWSSHKVAETSVDFLCMYC